MINQFDLHFDKLLNVDLVFPNLLTMFTIKQMFIRRDFTSLVVSHY